MAESLAWNRLNKWCREMAEARGGLCLTESVSSESTPVRWRCASGHTWEAPPGQVARWCPKCTRAAGRAVGPRREEICRRIVRSHRSVVVGFTDPGMSLTSRFRVRCCHHHVFDVRLDWLLAGAWCPECAWQKTEQRLRYLELRKAQKHALSNGGALLTEAFEDPMLDMKWRCIAGHRFKASWFRVQQRELFCPVCAGLRASGRGDDLPRPRDPRGRYPQYTLADMQAAAKNRGGRCLSTKFHRLADSLEWQCAKGHRFTAAATCVIHGPSWCRRCSYDERAARHRKYTVEACTALVAARGGRCVSERFVKVNAKLEWECSEGHRFKQTVIGIKEGRWCRECARIAAAPEREKRRLARKLARRVKVRKPPQIKGTLEEMQERARALGGRCLSTEYRGANHPLQWECAEGHRWFGRAAVVGLKTWCRTCRYKENGLKGRRYTLADCQEMARARGGKCLSKAYVASHQKMRWECAEGHRWNSSSDTVRQGHWCRQCSIKIVAKKRLKTLAKRKREDRKRRAVG